MNSTHHELLAQVAALYYEQEMTQNAIANILGVSRVKVYRLLKEAKTNQVVEIIINWPNQRDTILEQALLQQFDLKEALVLKTSSTNQAISLHQLGQLGARYLERILTDGATMAVCLGQTSYETIQAISPNFQAKVRVAQAVGSLPYTLQERDSATLARELAHKLGGDVLYLTSPLMADSVEAAQIMRSQRDIQRTLLAACKADVALTGIGNLDPDASGFIQGGFIEADTLTSLTDGGAVGDIAGQIYSLNGELYPCDFNQRVIGITLEALKQIPLTMAVAMGQAKAPAILGALRTGVINVLCVDNQAAAEIIRLSTTQ